MYLNQRLFLYTPACPTCLPPSLSLYTPLSLLFLFFSFFLCSQKDFKSTRNIWGFSALFLAPSTRLFLHFSFLIILIPIFQTRVLSTSLKFPYYPLHNAVTASRSVLRASFQKKTYSNGTPLQPNMMGHVDNVSCCTFRVSGSTPSLAHGPFLFHEVGQVQIFLFLFYFFLGVSFLKDLLIEHVVPVWKTRERLGKEHLA